jgi:RNA polymerase sigma factor (sigma-70 family)
MLPIVNSQETQVDYRRDALEECLKKLGDIGREIIRMRYNLGLKPKQISSHLGYTVANIYKVISRIQDKLLSCIERTLQAEGYTNE